MTNKPTYDFEPAIRAAVTKLNKVCSDSRRRALVGNDYVSGATEDACDGSDFGKGCPIGKVKARRRYDASVPHQLNLVEFCDDSVNAENAFLKCFWEQAPESYMDLSLSAVSSITSVMRRSFQNITVLFQTYYLIEIVFCSIIFMEVGIRIHVEQILSNILTGEHKVS